MRNEGVPGRLGEVPRVGKSDLWERPGRSSPVIARPINRSADPHEHCDMRVTRARTPRIPEH